MERFSLDQSSVMLTSDAEDEAKSRVGQGKPCLCVFSKEEVMFWIAGILNNASYVLLNAGAKEIAPSAVGWVYVCNVFPSFFTKLSGPYWLHRVPYRTRAKVIGFCMALSFSLVALGQWTDSLFLQFFGVAVTSFQAGFGEVSFLALSAFYPDSRRVLTAWSSGTGVAGIFGYAFVSFFLYLLKVPFVVALITANVFPLVWALTVYRMLPWSAIDREGKTRGPPNVAGTIENVELIPSDNRSSDGNDPANSATATMTFRERLSSTLALWKYMVPLFVVYFSEYAIQSGVWAAIGFPITSKESRNKFYELSNWAYQVGVFLSRSSGTLWKANLKAIWALPFLQVCMFFFFWFDAYYMFWYNWSLLFPAFFVGLIGGLVYVQAFSLLADSVDESKKEFSLSAASIADSVGILMSNVCGIWIQKALYTYHGIQD